jgi:DNA-binding MarR family transcriptional regulator
MTPQPRSEGVDALVDAVLGSSRALVALSARSIAGAGDVTLPQYRMLVVLDGAATNLSTLAASLDVAPSTALRMVDRLVAAGLIERSVRQENRRETHLALTVAGRNTVATVTERRRRDIRAVLERMPRTERDRLVGAMEAFTAAAEALWRSEAAEIPR